MSERLLKIENDWENYTYYVDGVKIDPKTITEVKINGTNRKVKEYREDRVSVSDHGKSYWTTRWEVIIEVDGLDIKVSQYICAGIEVKIVGYRQEQER